MSRDPVRPDAEVRVADQTVSTGPVIRHFGNRKPSRPSPFASAGAETLPLWEEIWPGPAMKLVGPLAARSPGLRLALALEIERHCSADEILQGRLIDLVAFVDVDGAPDIPVEAGVE